MIYPYTIILHGVMAVLCLISLIYLFYKKLNIDSRTINHYFSWFLFFFLYNIALILPLLIFKSLTYLTALFYSTALLFLIIGAWQALNTVLKIFVKNVKISKILSILYLAGGIFAVILNLFFLQTPIGTADSKWVLWHPENLSYVTMFYTLFMFIAGWTFALSMLVGFKSLNSTILKLKSVLLFTGAFLLPLAAFYYFNASNDTDIYLAFLFSIASLFVIALGNILMDFFKKETAI